MRLTLLLLSFLLLTFSACDKDEEITESNTPTLPGTTITANFFGQLTDNTGTPVEGALVQAGNMSALTNADGLWAIDNADIVEDQAYVTFSSDEHLQGSRTVLAKADSRYELNVQVLSKAQSYLVDATTGGTVNIQNSGAQVEFPSEAFAKTDGSPVTGMVTVVAHYLDPNGENFEAQMPGDLRAQDANDNTQLLISYGMLAVELTDVTGEEVVLKEGKEATLRVPEPSNASGTNPSSMPLWYFDKNTAMWIEEGSATLENGVYVGQVSHFTFWNCDIPTDYILLCGTVLFEGTNESNSGNITLIIESQNWGSTYGYTDENGVFCGIVPANETLILYIYIYIYIYIQSDCEGEPYLIAREIGPFTSDTDIGTILTSSGTRNIMTNVTGLATCNGVPISDGVVNIFHSREMVASVAIRPDGSFTKDFLLCDNSDVTVQVENLATRQTGEQTFPHSNNILTGTIEACDEARGYFEMTIDGITHVGGTCVLAHYTNGLFRITGSLSNGGSGANFVLSFGDASLPHPIEIGTYTTPTTTPTRTGGNLSIFGFSNVESYRYEISEVPYSISEVADANFVYTVGEIGPAAVDFIDRNGNLTSTHTVQLAFYAKPD